MRTSLSISLPTSKQTTKKVRKTLILKKKMSTLLQNKNERIATEHIFSGKYNIIGIKTVQKSWKRCLIF